MNIYRPYEVIVDTSINSWADFSKEYGINYKLLKLHNPWLRESYLTNKLKKKYFIEIPQKETIPCKIT